jgi:UDP-N-acetylglucosamine 1-carboxyvinyltransferase
LDKFVVKGGRTLSGSVEVSGAKNSALPLLFSTLLAEGRHEFTNVPNLKDIESTCVLLESLGCKTEQSYPKIIVDCSKPKNLEAHYDLVRKMRASILCLGPLLAKYGEAVVSLPGGCAIGTRPIDLHLDAMKTLGAEIDISHGYVHAKAKKLKGAIIDFKMVTVGGTENAMMAACLAEGQTVLNNAAQEPEIVDLANYLNKMGAKVRGAGSSQITIDGVNLLKPSQHEVIPDRIEAATLLIAGAITKGEVTITHCIPAHIQALIDKMEAAGFKIESQKSSVKVFPLKNFKGVDVETAPFPGFATDIQAQYMALMTVCSGESQISETIFENRFMHVQELVRLGADIWLKGQVAKVIGKPNGLKGAPVMATDLRASASLVLAGLAAEGETHVGRIYHLDRGYEGLEKKLSSLGAHVERVAT